MSINHAPNPYSEPPGPEYPIRISCAAYPELAVNLYGYCLFRHGPSKLQDDFLRGGEEWVDDPLDAAHITDLDRQIEQFVAFVQTTKAARFCEMADVRTYLRASDVHYLPMLGTRRRYRETEVRLREALRYTTPAITLDDLDEHRLGRELSLTRLSELPKKVGELGVKHFTTAAGVLMIDDSRYAESLGDARRIRAVKALQEINRHTAQARLEHPDKVVVPLCITSATIGRLLIDAMLAQSNCINNLSLPEMSVERPLDFLPTGWKGAQYVCVHDVAPDLSPFLPAGKEFDERLQRYLQAELNLHAIRRNMAAFQPDAQDGAREFHEGASRCYTFAAHGLGLVGELEALMTNPYVTVIHDRPSKGEYFYASYSPLTRRVELNFDIHETPGFMEWFKAAPAALRASLAPEYVRNSERAIMRTSRAGLSGEMIHFPIGVLDLLLQSTARTLDHIVGRMRQEGIPEENIKLAAL